MWYINKYEDCIAEGDRVIAEKPHGVSPEWLENARLIAAAPELLEALEDIIQAHDVKMGKLAVELRIERARDAIAKAGG